MENSLLSQEKITRMTYAESLNEGVKILYESNYAGGIILDNPYMYEELLKAEDKKVTAFLREVMPKNSGLECFLVRLDYHNAKAIYKAKLLGEGYEYMLLSQGLIEYDKLKEAIDTDNYFAMPKAMSDTIIKLKAQVNPSPRMIDVELDKAMYLDIMNRLAKVKAKSIKDYWTSNIDLSNVATLIRLKDIPSGDKLLKECLISGGSISIDTLLKLTDAPMDSLVDRLRYTGYGRIIERSMEEYKATKSLVAYEREWDNYLLDLFKRDRHDIFSVAPIAGFYVSKRIEQKVIRLIFVCLKNKVDVSHIKQRLRDIYA